MTDEFQQEYHHSIIEKSREEVKRFQEYIKLELRKQDIAQLELEKIGKRVRKIWI